MDALEQLDIERVLGDEGLDYKTTWGGSGRQINLRCCPFCGNNKWKVYLNADSSLGNCFAGSCTQGTFNKWQLLRAIYDLAPKDMFRKIEVLAADQGWRPKITPKVFEPGPLDLPPNHKITDLYALPKYLLERGIDRDVAGYFDLRWCETGTFRVKDPDGKTIEQNYANRVLIPIYDAAGELVSFQGRDATGTSERKYLFPPMYASTGSHLYNIHNWQAGMHTVVIGEGVFDVFGIKRALDAAGIKDTLPLGSFGMSFSIRPDGNDQLSKLLNLKKLGLKRVVLLWDNEPVALRKAITTALAISRYGFEVAVAKLPVCSDPGEASLSEIHWAITNAHPVRSRLEAMLLERKIAP